MAAAAEPVVADLRARLRSGRPDERRAAGGGALGRPRGALGRRVRGPPRGPRDRGRRPAGSRLSRRPTTGSSRPSSRSSRNVAVVVSSGAPVAMPWAGRVARHPAGMARRRSGRRRDRRRPPRPGRPGRPARRDLPRAPRRHRVLPLVPDRRPAAGALRRGTFTGYRWHDAREIEPLFPFGHGLSYTTFAYEAISAERGGHRTER